MSDNRQNNQLTLAFAEEYRGEAPKGLSAGTESFTAKRGTESPAIGEQLMEEVCGRENCKRALARIKANKGSAGMDGMTVQQLPEFLKQHWPEIRERLLSGTYKPQPVKRVEIPKPDGGNTKAWYSDGAGSIYPARFIQQAVMQVLQCRWGPDIFRTQLRVSPRAVGASSGGTGAAVYRRRLSLGGGSGSGEVLRPGEPRQTDGEDRRKGRRQANAEADPGVSHGGEFWKTGW